MASAGGVRLRALARLPLRMADPAPAKGKAAGAAPAAAAKAAPAKATKASGAAPTAKGKMVADKAAGTNLLKGQADPPLAPADAYPPWLWALASPPRTLKDLLRAAGPGLDQLAELPRADQRRLFDLHQRAAIKDRNLDLGAR